MMSRIVLEAIKHIDFVGRAHLEDYVQAVIFRGIDDHKPKRAVGYGLLAQHMALGERVLHAVALRARTKLHRPEPRLAPDDLPIDPRVGIAGDRDLLFRRISRRGFADFIGIAHLEIGEAGRRRCDLFGA